MTGHRVGITQRHEVPRGGITESHFTCCLPQWCKPKGAIGEGRDHHSPTSAGGQAATQCRCEQEWGSPSPADGQRSPELSAAETRMWHQTVLFSCLNERENRIYICVCINVLWKDTQETHNMEFSGRRVGTVCITLYIILKIFGTLWKYYLFQK